MIQSNNLLLLIFILVTVPDIILSIGVADNHATGHAGINSASIGYSKSKNKGVEKYDTKKIKKQLEQDFTETL